jgi:Coenzyme PQQ synthesis protein D (PqqD)
VGARIWELVQTPRRVGELRDRIVAEYDVEPPEAERDLLDLLADLARRGLVDVRHDGRA